MTKTGEEMASAALAEAREPVASRRARCADPAMGEPRGGVPPGLWGDKADEYGLPPDCPVRPLGFSGERPRLYYFLDPTNSLRVQAASEFSKQQILSLFHTRSLFLPWAWPRWVKVKKDGETVFEVSSFDGEKAAAALMDACGLKGAWDPVEKLRGRGAWAALSGELVLHCGGRLYIGPREVPPGEYEGYLYPEMPRIHGPWPKRVRDADSPAYDLLPMLRTWQWERKEADPVLFLGWMGMAMIGGALDARPIAYVTGDSRTGKSELQKLLKSVFTDALITSVNTTEAGVAQSIMTDTLPVAIDEMEPTFGLGGAENVIKLARQAFTGGVRIRGGADHKATMFQANSAFLFSSINEPPLEPQDLSRMVMFRLRRLPDGSRPPKMEAQAMSVLGRKILRRMMDGYAGLAQRRAHWMDLLEEAGHDNRGQLVFGTLLACAETIIGPQAAEELGVPMLDDLTPWAEWLDPRKMVENEAKEENWRRCLDYLLGAEINAQRNGLRPTVGQLLEELFGGPDGESSLMLSEARNYLATVGVGLVDVTVGKGGGGKLALPNKSPVLNRVYERTPWAAGGWATAIRQAPPEVWEDRKARVGGVSKRCKLVDIRAVTGGRDDNE